MKKSLFLLVVLSMLSVMLSGCMAAKTESVSDSGIQPGNSSAVSSVANNPVADSSAPAGKAPNPPDSYNAYIAVREDAYNRLFAKTKGNDELVKSIQALLSVTGADLVLMLPVTAISDRTVVAYLETLGLKDIKIEGSGNEYNITYANQNITFLQTCKYDPITDSLQSKITDPNGAERLFFEYVKPGASYASQEYLNNGDGSFMELRFFINDTDTTAFGMQTVSAQSASIFGNTSLTIDFVKDEDTYLTLQGDALTIFQDGEAKAY